MQPLLTVKQLARILHEAPITMYRKIRNDTRPHLKLGPTLRFDESKVIAQIGTTPGGRNPKKGKQTLAVNHLSQVTHCIRPMKRKRCHTLTLHGRLKMSIVATPLFQNRTCRTD